MAQCRDVIVGQRLHDIAIAACRWRSVRVLVFTQGSPYRRNLRVQVAKVVSAMCVLAVAGGKLDEIVREGPLCFYRTGSNFRVLLVKVWARKGFRNIP